MIFLIATVFTAQLVLLVNIVIWLVSADKKVCGLSDKISAGYEKLEWRLKAIKQITADINIILPHIIKKLKRKRMNLIVRGLNEFLQSIILLFFKPKYKKILLAVKIGAGALKDIAKS